MDRSYEQMASHDRHGGLQGLELDPNLMRLRYSPSVIKRLLIYYLSIAGDLHLRE